MIAAWLAALRREEKWATATVSERLPAIRRASVVLCLLAILVICASAQKNPATVQAQKRRIVIAASVLLDGRGHVLRDTRIVVEGSKIVALDPNSSPVDYDLRGFTVLPGWIDSHVHITWSFGENGKNAGADETTRFAAYQAASNAWLTLIAGFTTVQSVGSPTDVPLRDAIAKGALPGVRILTAVEPLQGRGEKTGTPDEIRAFVRKQKEAGADLIKIFASASIRQGGGMTLSQDQLNAACDEANKQGLRTLVHAYKDAVRAATLAGCTEIEHGTMATDEDLKLMAERGTYLDPQAGLVIENYLANKERFLGTPGYTEEGFAAMERVLAVLAIADDDRDILRRRIGIHPVISALERDLTAGTKREGHAQAGVVADLGEPVAVFGDSAPERAASPDGIAKDIAGQKRLRDRPVPAVAPRSRGHVPADAPFPAELIDRVQRKVRHRCVSIIDTAAHGVDGGRDGAALRKELTVAKVESQAD